MNKIIETKEDRKKTTPDVSADTVAILYFEQMKQIITLSVAVAGGTVTLLQTLAKESESRTIAVFGVAFLLFAAICALIVQEYVVERLGEATNSMRTAFFFPKWLRMSRTPKVERAYFIASMLCFAIGLASAMIAISGVLE